MKKTVLIVERNHFAAEQLKNKIENYGYQVYFTTSGKIALELAHKQPLAAVILEWDLEDMEGIEVCKQIRFSYSLPILMISSRIDELDSVVALELGATDYIRKPFGIRELITRLRIHIKRYEQGEQQFSKSIISFKEGPFKVDYSTMKIYKNNIELSLTYSEFKLLAHFISNPKIVMTRENLIKMLELTNGELRTIDVHIRRLREKIEERPSTPNYIKTKNRTGYYFNSNSMQLSQK